jgi:hypothetical protein
MLNLIKTDMTNLADIAPLIDYDIIEEFKDKYKDSSGHFATTTANICNGLTQVKVNRAEPVDKSHDKPSNKIVTPTEINTQGSTGYTNTNTGAGDNCIEIVEVGMM